jgi:hypothetical protein
MISLGKLGNFGNEGGGAGWGSVARRVNDFFCNHGYFSTPARARDNEI